MNTEYTHPKLRWPLDVKYHQVEKEHLLVLSCPIGLSDKSLPLRAGIGPVLSDFNGSLSLSEIANKYASYGVTLAVLDELVKLLDSHLFLDTNNYQTHVQQLKHDYHNSPVRSAFMAGFGYPSEPVALKKMLDTYLVSSEVANLVSSPLLALVTPHIDYRRGGNCYGTTYSHLPQSQHDLYILMGTAHQYSPLMFHLTKKDFETPLGNLNCAISLVNKLANYYGYERSFTDELLHKREHSLELQAPFLKHLNPDTAIVPILVGSFHTMVTEGKLPEEYPIYEEFAAALTECLKEELKNHKKVAFIAGVDMAHIGQAFGDITPLSQDFLEHIKARDLEYLEIITSQDKARLFQHIAQDQDARRICGFPTLYLLLDILGRLDIKCHIETFDYQQAVDYKTDCAVTFAGLGFYI